MARKKIAEEEKISSDKNVAKNSETKVEAHKKTIEETPEERSIAQKLISLY